VKTNNKNTRLAVIKIGGDMLLDASDQQGLGINVKALHDDGWQCVIVHGGGPQLTALQTFARRVG